MKHIIVLHLGSENDTRQENLLGHDIEIERIGMRGSYELACDAIARYDGTVDAIGLEDMPSELRLGPARRTHSYGKMLLEAAQRTPIVNGSGVRAGLERWGVILADRAEPGIFSYKRILMVPGLNHEGFAQALWRHTQEIRYADPVIYFGLPNFPGIGSRRLLDRASSPTLEQLKDAPFRRLCPQPGSPGTPRHAIPFQWADVLVGDIGAILRYSPHQLHKKIVLVNSASEENIEDLRQRGVSIVIAVIPNLNQARHGVGAATVEAILAALRPDPDAPLNEDTYLDMLATFDWKPDIRYLQKEDVGINRFAFVIHPLNISFVHKHRAFGWTRFLPNELVEAVAAYMPPIYLSTIKGGVSPTTGQRIEGYLYSLGATPRQMLKHSDRFTYSRLNQCARMAERKGARVMGLGAFTSVVGDAGITVAHESAIAITSGNSLTVAATLEAAKQAVIKMGVTDLTKGRAMVVGATGSIGSICSRLLAQAVKDVVLVSIEPEKLIDLKRTILQETPGSRVIIATKTEDLVGECDLIVTATSAFGQRVVDITRCKPGAVICDVARPPDISEAEADLRPDILVIESGEVLIPGDIDFGYDIGLPPKTSYACLGETALLAMEGRFEDYTLGRNITIERVKEIYHLFKKHQFQLAGLRSFEKYVTDEELAHKRKLADKYRSDPELFARMSQVAREKIVQITPMSKGVAVKNGKVKKWLWIIASAGFLVYSINRLRNHKECA
jgi:predicted amino acid dehydrogenase